MKSTLTAAELERAAVAAETWPPGLSCAANYIIDGYR
jgi:hypothetical protein